MKIGREKIGVSSNYMLAGFRGRKFLLEINKILEKKNMYLANAKYSSRLNDDLLFLNNLKGEFFKEAQ